MSFFPVCTSSLFPALKPQKKKNPPTKKTPPCFRPPATRHGARTLSRHFLQRPPAPVFDAQTPLGKWTELLPLRSSHLKKEGALLLGVVSLVRNALTKTSQSFPVFCKERWRFYGHLPISFSDFPFSISLPPVRQERRLRQSPFLSLSH